jgi:hypothetical protein
MRQEDIETKKNIKKKEETETNAESRRFKVVSHCDNRKNCQWQYEF